MAFLDEGGVADLTEQIRTLADATYAPIDHMHITADGQHTLGYASFSVNTSSWTSSTTAITVDSPMLIYMYASVRVAGLGLDEETGQTRPRIFLYESDHARRSPVYFIPAGTYYLYAKGTSTGTPTVYLRHIRID